MPMEKANLPALVLISIGLPEKRLEQVWAVPTQALPMVNGICGKTSITAAVQKSAKPGLIRWTGVGPKVREFQEKPSHEQSQANAHPQGCKRRGIAWVVEQPQDQGKDPYADDEVARLPGEDPGLYR